MQGRMVTAGSPRREIAKPRRGKSRVAIALALAASVVLAGCAADVGDSEQPGDGGVETITLKYGIHLTQNGMNSVQFRDYIDRVNSASENYQIELEEFYDGSLCTVQEQLRCTTDGRLDITMAMSVFAPTDMPITTMTEIPFVTSNEVAAALALRDLYEENEAYRQEFERLNQHMLFIALLPPNVHGFTRPVESLDDLRGMNYRTLGYVAQAFAAVGANPQAIPTAEVWESLERGIVEGFMGGFDFAANAGFQELTPYWYDMVGITVTAPMVINKDTWESLPQELRDVMIAEAEASYDTYFSDFAAPAYEALCSRLAEHLDYLGPFADNAAFAQVGLPAVEEIWVADQQGVIDDPAGLFAWYKDRVAMYEPQADNPTPIELCAPAIG